MPQATAEAALTAKVRIQGEGGLAGFLLCFLFHPLNIMLHSTLSHLLGTLCWEREHLSVAEPDVRLVSIPSGETEKKEVALLELKTIHAFPPSEMAMLLSEIETKKLSIAPSGSAVTDGSANDSRSKQPKRCRVLDQVGAAVV